MSNTAVYIPSLSSQELAAVRKLESEGHTRGLRYKIDPGTSSGILCRADNSITGFMTFDSFGGDDIETAAITCCRADWEAMFAVLLAEAAERRKQRVLFICSPDDTLVRDILTQKGLTPEYTEYRMTLEPAEFTPMPAEGVLLRAATEDDLGYIHELDALDVDDALLPGELQATRIIENGGARVGKLRIENHAGLCGIYGVAVEEALRGRGLGGAALSLLIGDLLTVRNASVYLEVDSTNLPAFHLYKKLGFRISSAFDYYPLEM